MPKYIAHWYNEEEVVSYDGPFEAESKESAERIAYTRVNGSPPAPLLWLEEV